MASSRSWSAKCGARCARRRSMPARRAARWPRWPRRRRARRCSRASAAAGAHARPAGCWPTKQTAPARAAGAAAAVQAASRLRRKRAARCAQQASVMHRPDVVRNDGPACAYQAGTRSLSQHMGRSMCASSGLQGVAPRSTERAQATSSTRKESCRLEWHARLQAGRSAAQQHRSRSGKAAMRGDRAHRWRGALHTRQGVSVEQQRR